MGFSMSLIYFSKYKDDFFHEQDILKTDPGMEGIDKKTANKIKPDGGFRVIYTSGKEQVKHYK